MISPKLMLALEK